MISGDQTACAEATALLGDIETAVVNRATGRNSAECLPPEVTTQLIRDAAERAVRQLNTAPAPRPSPFTADHGCGGVHPLRNGRCRGHPSGSGAGGGRAFAYKAEDMPTAAHAFRSLVGLASI